MNYLKSTQLLFILILILFVSTTVVADTLGYATAGTVSNTIGNEGVTNAYGALYTSSSGGSLTTAHIHGHTNWNGTDTVVILIYDDTGGYPHSLIGESDDIIINASSYQWWTAPISGSILPSTEYWIFVRNKTVGSASVRIHYDGNTITGLRASDTSPTNDPFANGATVNNNSEYSIYVTYATTSSPSTIPLRRRKIINLTGEGSEKITLYSYMPMYNQ